MTLTRNILTVALGTMLMLTACYPRSASPAIDQKQPTSPLPDKSASSQNTISDPTTTTCATQTPQFDFQRAWQYAKYQVDLGARPSDSSASRTLRQSLLQRLQSYGYRAYRQSFTANTPLGDKAMCNIVGELAGQQDNQATKTIIIGAHYDTKFFPDIPFVGANDGASGVAVLDEVARLLPSCTWHHKIAVVYFDGEEAWQKWSDRDKLYGSRHFVQELVNDGQVAQIAAALIVDMVGDKDLQITDDALSTPQLKTHLRQAARHLSYEKYLSNQYQGIDDDHVPFLQVGIPALDIIGFRSTPEGVYPSYWHTATDTLDKITPQSLQISGKLLLETLKRVDEELP